MKLRYGCFLSLLLHLLFLAPFLLRENEERRRFTPVLSIQKGSAVEIGLHETAVRKEMAPSRSPKVGIEKTAVVEAAKAGTGVDREAALVGELKPFYPSVSRRRGEEGRVAVRIRIDERGRIVRKDVVESSGFTHLDRAALEAFSGASFLPALVSGAETQQERVISFVFRLHEESGIR